MDKPRGRPETRRKWNAPISEWLRIDPEYRESMKQQLLKNIFDVIAERGEVSNARTN